METALKTERSDAKRRAHELQLALDNAHNECDNARESLRRESERRDAAEKQLLDAERCIATRVAWRRWSRR